MYDWSIKKVFWAPQAVLRSLKVAFCSCGNGSLTTTWHFFNNFWTWSMTSIGRLNDLPDKACKEISLFSSLPSPPHPPRIVHGFRFILISLSLLPLVLLPTQKLSTILTRLCVINILILRGGVAALVAPTANCFTDISCIYFAKDSTIGDSIEPTMSLACGLGLGFT